MGSREWWRRSQERYRRYGKAAGVIAVVSLVVGAIDWAQRISFSVAHRKGVEKALVVVLNAVVFNRWVPTLVSTIAAVVLGWFVWVRKVFDEPPAPGVGTESSKDDAAYHSRVYVTFQRSADGNDYAKGDPIPLLEAVRQGEAPPFRVTPSVEGRDWVRLMVQNNGPTRGFLAQVVAARGVDTDPALPWSVKWRDSEGECREIVHGAAALLDLVQANAMGAEGYLPWSTNDGVPKPWKPGQFRCHSISGALPVRLKVDRWDDLYEHDAEFDVEVRAAGVMIAPKVAFPTTAQRFTVSVGYNPDLSLRVSLGTAPTALVEDRG